MTIDGKGKFGQNVLTMGNNFLKHIMKAIVFCSLIINNVATMSKRNQHLRSHYTIFTKVVNELTQVYLL